jgi:hypothetical protein
MVLCVAGFRHVSISPIDETVLFTSLAIPPTGLRWHRLGLAINKQLADMLGEIGCASNVGEGLDVLVHHRCQLAHSEEMVLGVGWPTKAAQEVVRFEINRAFCSIDDNLINQ